MFAIIHDILFSNDSRFKHHGVYHDEHLKHKLFEFKTRCAYIYSSNVFNNCLSLIYLVYLGIG